MQKLKDLMSPDVKVISPDMTIGDAARKMRDGDFGMMCVGIVALVGFAVREFGDLASCPSAF